MFERHSLSVPQDASAMIRAVLFDLDETLLDRSTSLDRFLADQYARFQDRFGHVPFAAFRRRFFELDARGSVHKSIVYRVLLEEFAIPDMAAEALLEDYRENCPKHGRLFPGTEEVLRALRSKGIALAIVTNGETEFQQRHIDVLGLEPLVDAVLISEREGLRKPDPRLFRRAAQRVATPPHACLFVGDNPRADVLGAHAAGMQTVWFTNAQTWPDELRAPPGSVVADLRDLLPLLNDVLPPPYRR